MKKGKWIPKNGESVITCDKNGVPLSRTPEIFIGMSELSVNFPYVCQDKYTEEYDSYAIIEPYDDSRIKLWYLAEKVRKAQKAYDKAYAYLEENK